METDMMVLVTPLYYFGMSAQLKTVIDRFYSFNGILMERNLKTALIVAAWDNQDWTMKDIKSHYETLCRYLNFQDQGQILGIGCGTVSMTRVLGRVMPFLYAANEILTARGIKLPLPAQARTAPGDRLEKGAEVQAEIFGAHMREAWKAGHINRWLAANCFGDYYTRGGLDLKQRELITFCFLAAQGGCEPQLTAHAKGNMNLGNDKDFLIRVVSQCLPYIGYPRSLNAINCVNKAAES